MNTAISTFANSDPGHNLDPPPNGMKWLLSVLLLLPCNSNHTKIHINIPKNNYSTFNSKGNIMWMTYRFLPGLVIGPPCFFSLHSDDGVQLVIVRVEEAKGNIRKRRSWSLNN